MNRECFCHKIDPTQSPCQVCSRIPTAPDAEPVAPAVADALREARKIIADIDDYMRRPSRGDWGEECACCMGELLDDDRDAIARIDAALAAMGERS